MGRGRARRARRDKTESVESGMVPLRDHRNGPTRTALCVNTFLLLFFCPPAHRWGARARRARRLGARVRARALCAPSDARFGAQVRAAWAREASAARCGTALVPLAPHVPPGTATSSLTAAHLQAERIASSSMCVAAMKRRRGPTFDSRARVRFGGTTGTPFLPSRVKAASRTGTCTAAHARTRASSVTSAAAMRPARCARRVAACLGSNTPREHRYW